MATGYQGLDEIDPALVNPHVEQYAADFGAYNPTFKGLPPNTYPNKWFHYIINILLCLPVIGFTVGAGIGFASWGVKHPESNGWFNLGWFLAFIFVVLVLCYFFSAERRKMEREFLTLKINEQKIKKDKMK